MQKASVWRFMRLLLSSAIAVRDCCTFRCAFFGGAQRPGTRMVTKCHEPSPLEEVKAGFVLGGEQLLQEIRTRIRGDGREQPRFQGNQSALTPIGSRPRTMVACCETDAENRWHSEDRVNRCPTTCARSTTPPPGSRCKGRAILKRRSSDRGAERTTAASRMNRQKQVGTDTFQAPRR
jgi:hypothetical protein